MRARIGLLILCSILGASVLTSSTSTSDSADADDRSGTATTTAATSEIRYFVSCKPSSEFTVTAETFYSGTCDRDLQFSGQIPLSSTEKSSGKTTIVLDIPAGVNYWIVGVPMM